MHYKNADKVIHKLESILPILFVFKESVKVDLEEIWA